MSYQRATINCRRCYELMGKMSSDMGGTRYQNIPSHDARNQAMIALEETSIEKFKESCYELEQAEKLKANIKKALNACMNCRYQRPEIADIFDPSDGSV